MQSPRWVYEWLERYDQGGLDDLRDLPQSGRPRKILREAVDAVIARAASSGTIPACLQQIICDKTSANLHTAYVRKIMRAHGLSPKAPERIHVSRTGKKAVQNWQYRFNKLVSCLKRGGFALVMEDEPFFIHDMIVGRKYWFQVGSPIGIPYTGSHKRITAYGSIVADGRQFFRVREWFDAHTFVGYLKDLQRHFWKMAVVTDRASPHRSRAVRELLRENKNIKIIYLPKGSSFLNAMEECWHRGKRGLLVSEYYRTFLDMHRIVSLYYRIRRFGLDLLRCANRKLEALCTNF